jgi:hypothetical protein
MKFIFVKKCRTEQRSEKVFDLDQRGGCHVSTGKTFPFAAIEYKRPLSRSPFHDISLNRRNRGSTFVPQLKRITNV